MSRTLAIVAASLLLLGGLPVRAQPQAPVPTAAEVWDLTRLYPDNPAWDAERQAVAAALPGLAAARGTLGSSAAALRTALDAQSAALQRLRRLSVYASTQLSTANGDRRNQERAALVSALGGQFGSALAWVDPELQALGEARVSAMVASDDGLRKHAPRLRRTLRAAPHTLAPEAEIALASFAPVLGSFANTRELLVNADIAWPEIVVEGKPLRLSDTGYVALREHPDRAIRKQAFDRFWTTYAQHENTLGALLAQRVDQGVIGARLRRYPSAAAASLEPTEVPEAVLRTLVAQANAALPSLHRYLRLRQRMLKLTDLHYHDVYPPLVESSGRYPVPEASALTLAAMKPLGDAYQSQLSLALASRTMHVRPAPGKRSGAYATGVWGLTPYIFLNHTDDFQSLVTFAHEWGHGMHSVLSQGAQTAENAGYPLFLAEIASITSEVLLTQHLLARPGLAGQERVFVLSEVLERMRTTFFRQTMLAEFELLAHDARQRGEALSGQRFSEMYCGLLRKYHGADAGVMQIDPLYCREWAYIPHFHRPFYVYAYATSATAAQFFGERIAAGVPGARDAYLDVLRAGGSVPPHELLLKAGLDLTSPEPYRLLASRMDAVLDEIEGLLPR